MIGEDTAFYKALLQEFGEKPAHSQNRVWLEYALGTNDRGKDVIRTIKYFIPVLAGKRHLDVGSGYGGTCIAMARNGARSMGIDLDPRLIQLSQINLSDTPLKEVEFRLLDVMDLAQVQALGQFDILTCDNVIEHVKSVERLLEHFRLLLKPGGLVYLTIPNAFSIGQIRKECHYGLFGASLLDPWDAGAYLRQTTAFPYDVSFYYPYAQLEYFFRKFQFEPQILNPYAVTRQNIDHLLVEGQGLLGEYQTALDSGVIPGILSAKIKGLLENYLDRLEVNVACYRRLEDPTAQAQLGYQILRDYQTELWYVVLRSGKPTDRWLNAIDAAARRARRLYLGARRRIERG